MTLKVSLGYVHWRLLSDLDMEDVNDQMGFYFVLGIFLFLFELRASNLAASVCLRTI